MHNSQELPEPEDLPEGEIPSLPPHNASPPLVEEDYELPIPPPPIPVHIHEQPSPREELENEEEAPQTKLANITFREKIALGTLGGIIVVIAISLTALFRSHIPKQTDPFNPPYPIKGDYVRINKINTSWRRPTSKDKVLKTGTSYIPTALITLGKHKKDGVLRFFFENDQGKLVGDPIAHKIKQGKFAATNSNTAEIACTTGFDDVSKLNALFLNKEGYWHLLIREAPDLKTPSAEQTEILRLRISSQRK